ncbi:hypothetical protein DYY65_11045 [Nitrososphaera sp. AFS]|nr:hypothetical protein [Nitrososphaera sp. AFS]
MPGCLDIWIAASKAGRSCTGTVTVVVNSMLLGIYKSRYTDKTNNPMLYADKENIESHILCKQLLDNYQVN